MTKSELIIEITRLKMVFQKNAIIRFQDLHRVLDLIQGVGMDAITDIEDAPIGSLVSEEISYTGNQVFTTSNYFAQIYSIEVTGVGAMSKSQYTILSNNQFVINDQLDPGDFIVVIYSKGAIAGTLPYYSQIEMDLLLVKKEDKTNKQNSLATDGTGLKYPTVDAVNAALSAFSPAPPDASTTTKGIVKLAGDLSGTADLPTIPALVNKEDLVNKSTTIETDKNSDIKYPSVKAIHDWTSYIQSTVITGTTHTLVNANNHKQLIFTNAAAITVTIPTGLTSSFNCEVLQQGTGQITFVTSGTTLNYLDYEFPTTYSQKSLVAIDNVPNLTETYRIYGQLSMI